MDPLFKPHKVQVDAARRRALITEVVMAMLSNVESVSFHEVHHTLPEVKDLPITKTGCGNVLALMVKSGELMRVPGRPGNFKLPPQKKAVLPVSTDPTSTIRPPSLARLIAGR